MGILAFQWGEKELTLLQNVENGDSWDINAAAWDEDNKILRGLPEENLGTWFGISRKGRVAFLVDQVIHRRPYLWRTPVDFLRGEMSPRDYAEELYEDKPNNMGLIYDIVVADISSNSMFYISKKKHVNFKEVGFGVHTLSSINGLDRDLPKELRMKDLFNEIIGDYKNKQVTPKQMAEKFIYDPADANRPSENIEVEKEDARAVSTTTLAVKPSKEVMFYERYLVNGEWKDHDFAFKIE